MRQCGGLLAGAHLVPVQNHTHSGIETTGCGNGGRPAQGNVEIDGGLERNARLDVVRAPARLGKRIAEYGGGCRVGAKCRRQVEMCLRGKRQQGGFPQVVLRQHVQFQHSGLVKRVDVVDPVADACCCHCRKRHKTRLGVGVGGGDGAGGEKHFNAFDQESLAAGQLPRQFLGCIPQGFGAAHGGADGGRDAAADWLLEKAQLRSAGGGVQLVVVHPLTDDFRLARIGDPVARKVCYRNVHDLLS